MNGRRKSQALTCSLTRKRCACGKQVTAKQLTLYGVCDACFKARTAAPTEAAAAR